MQQVEVMATGWDSIDAARPYMIWLEFRRLMRGRVIHVVALGLAMAASEVLGGYAMLSEMNANAVPIWMFRVFLFRSMDTLMTVATLSALQAGIARPGLRRLTMTVAVVVMSLALSSLLPLVPSPAGSHSTGHSSFFLYLLWTSLASAVLLAVLYEWEWSADQVMEAIRSARASGETAERVTLESRLNAVQARIDPQLLFAVIDRAQVLYVAQSDAAERLLERLIDFLRATLPARGTNVVSLGHELELCGSYLDLRKGLREGMLVYEISSPPARHRYFPPSVLLPLLQSLIPDDSSVPLAVAIVAGESQSSLRIELSCTPASIELAHYDLHAAEEMLRRFFGERASIDIRTGADRGATLCLEIQHAAG